MTIIEVYFRILSGYVMAGKKFLIVDYDKKGLESMTKLFEARDIQVITAADGIDAYEKFKAEKPDLVIMEAMLPRLHGFDLTQKIFQETKGGVPVVIVTAVYKGHQYRNEALRNFGASDYFEKPFDQNKFLKSVLSLVQNEVDVGEEIPEIPDLPGEETVMENLAQRLKKQPPSAKKE